MTAGVADEGCFPFPGFGGFCLALLFCGSGEVAVEEVAPRLHFLVKHGLVIPMW